MASEDDVELVAEPPPVQGDVETGVCVPPGCASIASRERQIQGRPPPKHRGDTNATHVAGASAADVTDPPEATADCAPRAALDAAQDADSAPCLALDTTHAAESAPCIAFDAPGRGARGDGGDVSSMAPVPAPNEQSGLLPRSNEYREEDGRVLGRVWDAVQGEPPPPSAPNTPPQLLPGGVSENEAVADSRGLDARPVVAAGQVAGCGSGGASSNGLARVRPSAKDRHLAFIAKVDAQVRKKATRITDAYMLASELNDDGSPVEGEVGATGRPVGWTARQYRVARDGRLPIKMQPGYLSAATRIVESYKRAEAATAAPQAPVLNAAVVTVTVNQQFVYQTRDVTDE